MKKMMVVLIALIAGVFAGPYNAYCLEQTNSCFQSSCYNVGGSWELQDDGTYKCIYNTAVYSDYEVQAAFADCISQEEQCEATMEAGGMYEHKMDSSIRTLGSFIPTMSSSIICCGRGSHSWE